jgi:hypothetical protein
MNPTCQPRVAGCLRLNKYHVVQIPDAPGGRTSVTMLPWRASSRRSKPSVQAKRRTGGETRRRGRVRLHRALLQPEAPALDDRISKPYGVRAQGRIRLSRCHPNRVRARKPSFGIVPALPRVWKVGNESYRRAPNPDKRGRWTAAPSFSPFVVITYCWLF